MNPDEAGSRRRHPTYLPGAPLRPVHSETHSGGRDASRETEKARAGWLLLLFVALFVGGILAAIWLRDWRWAASGVLLALAVAVAGGWHDGRRR